MERKILKLSNSKEKVVGGKTAGRVVNTEKLFLSEAKKDLEVCQVRVMGQND